MSTGRPVISFAISFVRGNRWTVPWPTKRKSLKTLDRSVKKLREEQGQSTRWDQRLWENNLQNVETQKWVGSWLCQASKGSHLCGYFGRQEPFDFCRICQLVAEWLEKPCRITTIDLATNIFANLPAMYIFTQRTEMYFWTLSTSATIFALCHIVGCFLLHCLKIFANLITEIS